MRNFYTVAIIALGALSVACSGAIIYGEATDQWNFGGAMVGVLLLCYSFIVLFLRKLGMTGPRKSER